MPGKLLQQHFFNAEHAHTLSGDGVTSHRVQSAAYGDTIEFFLQLKNSTIADASFLATGSPATIACCNYLAQWLVGKTSEDALAAPYNKIADALEIAATQRHILLLIDNCLRHLCQQDIHHGRNAE